MNCKRLIILLFLAIMFTGCTKKELEPTPGYIQDNTYVNEYLGFSIIIPESWKIQDEGLEMFVEDDVILDLFNLSASKYDDEISYENNTRLYISADNTLILPFIENSEDYSEKIIKNLLLDNDSNAKIKNDKVTIDGIPFTITKAELEINDNQEKHIYYTTVINKFMVNFIVVYYDKDGYNEAQDILQSISFE